LLVVKKRVGVVLLLTSLTSDNPGGQVEGETGGFIGASQLTGMLPRRILSGKSTKAPVAQLDRAMAYGAIGWGFESLQAYL
jgi:hypothetical protein